MKSHSMASVRGEWEYQIPIEDARQFLEPLCGENAGLVVAEIELIAEDQEFSKPDWVGEAVMHGSRYVNANLVVPFAKWIAVP